MKSHINQLLEAKIIRKSCSPWASAIGLVRKKNGSVRLCEDYRLLNTKTRKNAFLVPRTEGSLDALCGARWFSTIDLASRYNQVQPSSSHRRKQAQNNFLYTVCTLNSNECPFGLCNAPSTLQRLMQRMFGDQQGQSLLLYLDNVIIFFSSRALAVAQ